MFRVRVSGFGVWVSGWFRVWYLVFGVEFFCVCGLVFVWCLVFDVWRLVFGVECLAFGVACFVLRV